VNSALREHGDGVPFHKIHKRICYADSLPSS